MSNKTRIVLCRLFLLSDAQTLFDIFILSSVYNIAKTLQQAKLILPVVKFFIKFIYKIVYS